MPSTNPVLTFTIRGTQALFAIVVFGLTTSLIKGHHLGSLPHTLIFVALVSGFSLTGAAVGIIANWATKLQGQIEVLVDAVVVILNVAGGTVSLKGTTLSSYSFK